MSKRKDQTMGMDITPSKTSHLSAVLGTVDDDLRSDKQTAFVREYPKDWNGTQAAIRAGYSEATACEQASRLLSKANVRATIDRRISQMDAVAEVDVALLVRELLDVATAILASLSGRDEADPTSEKALTQSRARLSLTIALQGSTAWFQSEM